MKKLLTIILFMFFALQLSGCSSDIAEKYPQVKEDFLESDYKELEKMSDNESLSYEELCQKYIEANTNKEFLKTIDEIKSFSEISNLKCKHTKEALDVSFKITFADDYIDLPEPLKPVENMSTVISFKFKDNMINYFTYDSNRINYIQNQKIIASIDHGQEERSIVLSWDSKLNIENKIYYHSNNYYYLPFESFENKIVNAYLKEGDMPEGYVTSSYYWDKQLEENEKILDELQENLDGTK